MAGTIQYGLSKVTTPLFGAGSIVKAHEDHEGMHTLKKGYYGGDLSKRPKLIPGAGRYEDLEYDNEYIVDKLYDVYLSGSIHDEHQPSHLVIPS